MQISHLTYVTRSYYLLTKPGIILGNLITVAAGFFLASKGVVDLSLFWGAFLGLSLIIASACICNNYFDRHIDKKMTRTKTRALAKGSISESKALLLSLVLLSLGIYFLLAFTNLLTLYTALIGFGVYVGIYTLMKSKSTHATLVGSIAGATPPVVGYVAVTNNLDFGALLFFLMLVTWQMPHFHAISLYRYEEYKKASIPILPVVKGVFRTKVEMAIYIVLFIGTTSLLSFYGYVKMGFFYALLALGGYWLYLCLQGFKREDTPQWARKMFLYSLVVITLLCLLIPFTVNGY